MTSTDSPAAAARSIDREALRRKYREERDKRLRPDGNAQYLQAPGRFAHYLDDPYTPIEPRGREDRPRHLRLRRRRIRRAGDRRAPGRGRRRTTCASSRRAATSAAPGTGTATPARSATPRRWSTCRCSRRPATCRPRSTRTRRRSSRTAGASAGTSASTTTPCSTPRSKTCRWDDGRVALGRPHQPRRRLHRAVRRPRHRSAARAQAARHPGHRVVRRALLPHQPLGLRLHRRRPARRADDEARRQARRHHRHRRHGGAVRAAPRASGEGALRLPAHAVVGRRARQRADRSRLVRRHRHAGLAAALARELHRQPGRRDRDRGPGAGRLDRPVAPHPRSAILPLPHGAADAARACWPRSRTPITRRWRRSAPASTRSSRDPATAQNLKAWYRQLCKRPCFHDAYLQAFNLPSVHLVDTDGKGVERITAARRGRGRRGVSAGLPDLRVGLRGRHRVPPPRRASTWSAATA